MIPKFNKDGYLPKGIHQAAVNEIKQRFGSDSSKRKELFKDFQSLVQLLRKQKRSIKKFLLDGSFVTGKELPGDTDCILIVKAGFNFSSPGAKQLESAKRLFNVHLFTFMKEDAVRYHKLIDFFGHDQEGRSKGLLEVIL